VKIFFVLIVIAVTTAIAILDETQRTSSEPPAKIAISLKPGELYELTMPGNLAAKVFELRATITGNVRLHIGERYFWDNMDWNNKTPLRMSLNVTSRFAGRENIVVGFENKSKVPVKIEGLKVLYDEESHVKQRMINSTADFLYLSDREFVLGNKGNGEGEIDAAALVQRMKALNLSNLNYLIYRWTEHEWPRFKAFAEFSKNHGINLGVTVTKTSNLPYEKMLEFAKDHPRFKFLMIDDFSYAVSSPKADKRAMKIANQIYHTRPDMSFIPVVYDLGDVKKKARSLAPYLDAIQWYHRGNDHPRVWFKKSLKRVRSAFKTTPVLLGIYDTPHSSENTGESSAEFSFLAQKLAHQYLHGSNRFGLDGGWAGDAYGFRRYFDERHEATRQLQFLKQTGLKHLANGSFEQGSAYWWYNSSYPQQPGFATKTPPKTATANIGAKSKYTGTITATHEDNNFRIQFPPQQTVEVRDWNDSYGGYYGQLSQLVSLPEDRNPETLSFRYKIGGFPKGAHELKVLIEGEVVWSKHLLQSSPWATVTVEIDAPNADSLKLKRNFYLLQFRVAARKNIFRQKSVPVQVEIDDIRLNGNKDPVFLSESFDTPSSWDLRGTHSFQNTDLRSASDHCLQLDFDANPYSHIKIDKDVSGYSSVQFEYRFESNDAKEIWLLYPVLKQIGTELFFKEKPIGTLTPKRWHDLRVEIANDQTRVFLDQRWVQSHSKPIQFMAQFGAFGGKAAGRAMWDNMQFQNHWRGGTALTFNRKVFNHPLNQAKTEYHGLNDVQPSINPRGAAQYVSKLHAHWQVLQLENGATASKALSNDALHYLTTFLYKYLEVGNNSIIYKSDDGVLLEQRGDKLYLNGSESDRLVDSDIWYRLTLAVDKRNNRLQLLRDWESKKLIENVEFSNKMSRLTLSAPSSGRSQWDQFDMFRLD
jgi:hypothetical protein